MACTTKLSFVLIEMGGGGQVPLTPITLRSYKPSGFALATYEIFHQTSWIPAIAGNAALNRARATERSIRFAGGCGGKRVQNAYQIALLPWRRAALRHTPLDQSQKNKTTASHDIIDG